MTGALLKWTVQLLTWNSLQGPSVSTILKSLCTQFSQYLHENASYVRPLEEGMLQLFESITEDTVTVLVRFLIFSIEKDFYWAKILMCCFSFQETAVKLKAFSEHLASYLCFLRKILPYQLKRYFWFDQIKGALSVRHAALSTSTTQIWSQPLKHSGLKGRTFFLPAGFWAFRLCMFFAAGY